MTPRLPRLTRAESAVVIHLARLGDWVYGDDIARALGVTQPSLLVYVSHIRKVWGRDAIESSKGFQGAAKYRLPPEVMAHAR